MLLSYSAAVAPTLHVEYGFLKFCFKRMFHNMNNTNELQRVQKNIISCLTACPYGSKKQGILNSHNTNGKSLWLKEKKTHILQSWLTLKDRKSPIL